MLIPRKLLNAFHSLYGDRHPRVYRAPGRVNLIGEHTDYNDGFVMPAAIDLYVWVAISPRNDRKLNLCSTQYSEAVAIDLRENCAQRGNRWADYVQGIALMLQLAGHDLRGANVLIHGDVPIGAGLSSSAAIAVASGFALLQNSLLPVDRVELAQLCRRAENEFVGARVGIMDPFASCFGHAGKALLLDCRSLEFRLLPLPQEAQLVICNTMVRHDIATSGYNTRRSECEQAVQLLSRQMPHVRALRDVTLADLEANANTLPAIVHRRCRHVISENARVVEAANALARGDMPHFGKLMGESHISLGDDYEVSCEEIEVMVEAARRQPGVYGARMMGGGFGGSTINLVKAEAVPKFKNNVAEAYERATGIVPQIFVSTAAQGAHEVTDAT